jgi:hypothetical protein
MPEGPAAGFLFFAMMYEMVQVQDAFEAEFIHARIPFDSVRRPPQYEKLATSLSPMRLVIARQTLQYFSCDPAVHLH